jgi:hypothetical protein
MAAKMALQIRTLLTIESLSAAKKKMYNLAITSVEKRYETETEKM